MDWKKLRNEYWDCKEVHTGATRRMMLVRGFLFQVVLLLLLYNGIHLTPQSSCVDLLDKKRYANDAIFLMSRNLYLETPVHKSM